MTGEFDRGSFKDPEGRVYIQDGNVFRTLSGDASRRMRALSESGVLGQLAASGLLIPTRFMAATDAGLDAATVGESVLQHERIPLFTYPYEWSFDMLRDGALTTLDLLETCLAHDLVLKDASAYNVAPHRGRMVFFDALSIDRYEDGMPWEGYAQFCREFVFPLMLTAYRRVEFQHWFRGQIDGLDLSAFARLLSWRDCLRKGVFRHVVLQAKLERSFAGQDVKLRGSFKDIKYSKDLIVANLHGLHKLLRGLRYRPENSIWIDYAGQSSYSDAAQRTKADFVVRALRRIAPEQVIDLGCNTGAYALAAAQHAARVTAVDNDPACINVLYRRLKESGIENVVPVVNDLLNPSPALGWNLQQRRSLLERVRSNAFLALALVHHIRIAGNVPLAAILDLLRNIAPAGVVEWVDKSDGMVARMLRNRADVFDDYNWKTFERLLRERFTLSDVAETHDGARKLCLLLPREA